MRYYSTWAGVILCVGLFIYLTRLAKRALAKAQAEQEAREARGEMGDISAAAADGVSLRGEA
jgi:hypothetical protein